MILGICAQFGDVLGAAPWQQLFDLDWQAVRTGIGPGDDRLFSMLRDLTEHWQRPALINLSRQHIDHGTADEGNGRRVEASEMAAHAVAVYLGARSLGWPDAAYAFQLGNEADISTYERNPLGMAATATQAHDALRDAGFQGDIVAPSVSNLHDGALDYLERMVWSGLPVDMVIGVHMYPPTGYVPTPRGDDCADLWARLRSIAVGRRTCVTEFGFHTAAEEVGGFLSRRLVQLTDAQVTTGLLSYLAQFEREGVERAFVYQHRDGHGLGRLDRYGVFTADYQPKPQAALPALWRQTRTA